MDDIIILDDNLEEEDEKPQPSSNTSFCTVSTKTTSPASTPSHITKSPFASSHKERHIIKLENEKLFAEFMEHCSTRTQEHPEVIDFIRRKHAKASPDFLASVEFRNTLGRCLTRAQAKQAKIFVYINELCTVLKQHTEKKRQSVTAILTGTEYGKPEETTQREEPGEEEVEEEEQNQDKKKKKASRRQIAYLENLLKLYNEEISRLQERELSMNDLMEEDSSYIQEHRLKRKLMKIYDKLCELKGCSSLTGRVIEQRVLYRGTRYPEINKKIERFINSPEAQHNPPDYTDILKIVQRANERYNLSLSKKQVKQIAQDAFRDTGNRLQERRHLDMVYNFGSRLTDNYKPTLDPAHCDPSLARKLRSNREKALSTLDEVIAKYALQQDEMEEEERRKRQAKEKLKQDAKEKAGEISERGEGPDEISRGPEEGNESEEDEQDEEEEEDVSSDTDIDDELKASQSLEGADDEGEEEVTDESDIEGPLGSVVSSCQDGEPVNINNDEDSQSGSSSKANPVQCELSADVPSPSQSGDPPITGSPATVSPSGEQDPCMPSSCLDDRSNPCSPTVVNHDSPVLDSTNQDVPSKQLGSRLTNGSPPPTSPVQVLGISPVRTGKKRKLSSEEAVAGKQAYMETIDDIPLHMAVYPSSPQEVDSTQIDSPSADIVSSTQSMPPAKKNKVNAATQCYPDELIVISDSD